MTLLQWCELAMRLCAGAFAGACLYILVVQQPARMARATADALDDFRAAIPRAERLQAPLLIACLLAVVAVLVQHVSVPVIVGGVLQIVVLVLTIATVLPINRRLLSGAAADHMAVAGALLARWGRLHAVRTVVTVVAAVFLLA